MNQRAAPPPAPRQNPALGLGSGLPSNRVALKLSSHCVINHPSALKNNLFL